MKSSAGRSLVSAIAKAATKLNQNFKERTARGKAPDPHWARGNRSDPETLKAVRGETVREVVLSVAKAVKSSDLDR